MNKYTICAVLAASSIIALSGCKETNNYIDDGDRTRIRLSSSVELGNDRALQDLQIAQGQELSLFITNAGEEDEVVYDNELIVASGTGTFVYETLYYPSNGNSVDFYAVHPYSEDARLDDNIDFTIAADQSTQLAYLSSDLLHATREDVAPTNSQVSLVFSHKLTKLDFVIKQGDGADISDLNAVTTLGALTATQINPINGNIAAASGDRAEIISYGVTAPVGNDTQVSGISAIIIPQTFDAATRLFRIRVGSLDYYYTPEDATTFVGGSRYTLELTIRAGGIDLVSSIAPWTNGGTIIGDGNIE